jgi:feruloyl esterase
MLISTGAVAVALSLCIEPASAQSAAVAASRGDACRALANLSLADLTSIEAEPIAAGPFTVPAAGGPGGPRDLTAHVPAFCRVRGVVAPAIRFEVWLPAHEAWNGKFQAVGGGGFAGVISYRAMLPNIQAGYVTASTDTGHVAGELDWLGDEGRLRDYGYRAIHEMTVKAKAIIDAHYDRAAEYSYFNGCSTGGRQGLMEAQRFPEDYDGIVSGAPVNYFVATHFTQLWVSLSAKPTGGTLLAPADLELVNNEVLAQCDGLDGVQDGVLENPLACDFDPAALQCSSGQSGDCLTGDQVSALRKIYAGPAHPRTGERLHPSLVPGGEPAWSLVGGSELADIPLQYFARSVLDDAGWDWRTFDFDRDAELAAERTGEILDAIDPDLTEFRDRGGKLVLYHGWNDQVIFPEGSIDYYENVDDTLSSKPGGAAENASDFFRLFMVPGMTHCRGGPGTDQFDAQAAVEAWVERGVAPASIEARHVEDGDATRTRPLCPYPQVARYDGSGDTDDTRNFVCAE